MMTLQDVAERASVHEARDSTHLKVKEDSDEDR